MYILTRVSSLGFLFMSIYANKLVYTRGYKRQQQNKTD